MDKNPTKPLDVESGIDRVDVYRTQVLVHRRGIVPQVEKRSDRPSRIELRFDDLPLLLLDDSVRVSLVGATGQTPARVIDVHVEWSLGGRDGRLDTQAEAELRSLHERRVEMQAEQTRLSDQMRLLESLIPPAFRTTELPDPLAFAEARPLPAWLDLAAFVRAQQTDLKRRYRAIEHALRALGDRIAQTRDRLDQESRAQAAAVASCRKAVRVVLELGDAGAGRSGGSTEALPIELSYLVAGARWIPEYELRVDDEADQAELVVKALVAQATGEDWLQARMSFSTANLTRSAKLPELDAWRIGKAQPAKRTGWRALPGDLDDLFAGYDKGAGPSPVPTAPSVPEPELPSVPRMGDAARPRRDPDAWQNHIAERLEAPAAEPEPEPEEMFRTLVVEPDTEAEMCTYDDNDNDDDDDEATGIQPFTMPPPAPAPAMVGGMAPKRKGGFGGFGAPFRHAAAAPEVTDRISSAPTGVYNAPSAQPTSVSGPIPTQGFDSALDASQQALAFGDLRMQGPAAGDARGSLVSVSAGEHIACGLAQASAELRARLAQVPIETWTLDAREAVGALADVDLPPYAFDPARSAGHFAVRYAMEGSGRILSDGQLHTLTLLRRQDQVRRVHCCVPLIDETVYQIAELTNPVGLPLLAGPVRIYQGGDFVVTAPIATTAPGKPLIVNLGAEPGIKVARNVRYRESSGGLFAGETVLEHHIDLEIRSELTRSASIEIFERLPVSRDDAIEVTLIDSEPLAEPYDQRERNHPIEGGLRLCVELAPGATRRCFLKYKITLPSKRTLHGGNRRD